MFPLTVVQYVKLAAGALLLLGSFWFGWHLRDVDFMAFKVKIVQETAKIEKDQQAKADQIAKEKNAQIASINSQLADALVQLRGRPSRADQASLGQDGTGRSLSAEDASFLTREAARADQIRAGLQACYQQYDSLK